MIEGGKFFTSGGRGVFLDQALELSPADRWRWWLTANAPESSDADFSFGRFVTDVDHDLADKFGNLVQRVLVTTRHDGFVPDGSTDPDRHVKLSGLLNHLRDRHEALALRGTADAVRAIWKASNGYLFEKAPWTLVKTDPGRAAGMFGQQSTSLVSVPGQCGRSFQIQRRGCLRRLATSRKYRPSRRGVFGPNTGGTDRTSGTAVRKTWIRMGWDTEPEVHRIAGTSAGIMEAEFEQSATHLGGRLSILRCIIATPAISQSRSVMHVDSDIEEQARLHCRGRTGFKRLREARANERVDLAANAPFPTC